jgi:hypothetical protein
MLAALIISTLACSVPNLGGSSAPEANALDGWLRYDNGDMNLIAYRPSGWEISWYDYDNFDIFEVDGEGYIEVYQFNEDTAYEYWAMEFRPGMSKEQLLDDIVAELAYILYDIPHETQSLPSAAGDAIGAFGYDDQLGEGEFIAVVMQPDQAIVVFASDYSRQGFETRLPTYEAIVENMALLD